MTERDPTPTGDPHPAGDQEPASDAAPTQLTCGRCGSARSKSASFCGVCGQDLRPGAVVVPLPAPEPASAAPETGKRRLGGLGRGKSGEQAAPGTAASRGGGKPLPDRTPAPKPGPAVVPPEDTTLSFSERYRGTAYGNPDIERLLPPPTGASPRGRWPAVVGAIVTLAVLAAALVGGSWFLFLSPDAAIGPGTSASAHGGALSSVTPRATPRPAPTINGLVADEAEIVACRLIGEVAGQGTALDAIRADVAARITDGLAGRMDEVTAAMALSATDLPTLEAVAQSAELAAAYRTLHEQAGAAFKAVKAASTAKALKKTLKQLDVARKSYQTVLTVHQAFIDAYPEASCLIVP